MRAWLASPPHGRNHRVHRDITWAGGDLRQEEGGPWGKHGFPHVLVFFGAHISATGGIHTTLDRAEAMKADSVQLFTQSPRMWRPTNHDPANFETFKRRRAELRIAPGGVLAHALYS